MNTNANKIQAVINTLQTMEIKAKSETMGLLMGCLQVLAEVRDDLNKPAEEEKKDEAVAEA